MVTRRVLITGSRTWEDWPCVYAHLNSELAVAVDRDQTLVVVHGACPRGADLYAHQWTVAHQYDPAVAEEPHPADWSHGRSAGIVRNHEMVNLGADICLAFGNVCDRCPGDPHHVTHGTAHCARIAWEAGIRTRHFGDAW